MANPNNPTIPTPLTIGVEMEGVMGVMGEKTYQELSRDNDDLAKLRPFLVRPRPYINQRRKVEDFDSDTSEFDETAQEWLFKAIRKSLANNVGVFLPEEQGPDPTYNARQDIHTEGGNPYYYFWRVIDDPSAELPYGAANVSDGMSYPGFELLTPAMWFNNENLRDIANVYRRLFKEDPDFRPSGPRAPRTCGFHVHVGIGAERFSAYQIRRIACVAYATGELLSQLQPDHRKNEREAANCRWHSNLAFVSPVGGRGETDSDNVLDFYRRHVEENARKQKADERDLNYGFNGGMHEVTLDEPAEVYVDTGSLKFSWQTDHNNAASSEFTRRLPRGSLPSERVNLLADLSDENSPPKPPRSIAGAVGVLMRCQSPALVTELMDNGNGVLFRGYAVPARKYGPKLKPTVEWRQMASTFHPEAVVAWITVAAHLTRAAIDWPWEDLNKLLRRCARGEAEPDKYDVFDLLVDIGCAEQAQLIQDMVMNGTVGSPFYHLENREGVASQQ